MTGDHGYDIREIQFASDSARKHLQALPNDLKTAISLLFGEVQYDSPLPRDRKKDLKGDLDGITELRQDYDGDTYRAYYVASYREVLFVLDVDMKKSPKGGEIPRQTKVMLKERQKLADRMYERDVDKYREAYSARESKRNIRDAARNHHRAHSRRPK